jgi:hypothetical protein
MWFVMVCPYMEGFIPKIMFYGANDDRLWGFGPPIFRQSLVVDDDDDGDDDDDDVKTFCVNFNMV